jgi:hypothetical protein
MGCGPILTVLSIGRYKSVCAQTAGTMKKGAISKARIRSFLDFGFIDILFSSGFFSLNKANWMPFADFPDFRVLSGDRNLNF